MTGTRPARRRLMRLSTPRPGPGRQGAVPARHSRDRRGGATGLPGDIYLVHALTVRAADEHRGIRPRLMVWPGCS
ncbi:hypothetical protein [Nonomuraea helvata]|uniref:hypothetical protein n=1 Tax=Nonomuraea helvata TaxID=37484 RepID=UPI0033787CDE